MPSVLCFNFSLVVKISGSWTRSVFLPTELEHSILRGKKKTKHLLKDTLARVLFTVIHTSVEATDTKARMNYFHLYGVCRKWCRASI